MSPFIIRRPDDFHVHLRQGDMLRAVMPATARHFGRALVMPNTDPPILTGPDAVAYCLRLMMARPAGADFTPLLAIKLVPSTTPEIVLAAKKAGVTAGKLYPLGVTTNSADGVDDIEALAPAFEAMERCGMALCLHGETPGAFSLDREAAFLPTLRVLTLGFPRLRIVLEHVSSAAAVEAVTRLPDTVAATITVHHLRLTLDDVVGDTLKPHHFCKPIAKRPEDRDAVLAAAVSGNPKFFLGTDSAPHAPERKECASGCAGVYSAPVALPALADSFERAGALDRLEDFASTFGARFYGLPFNEGRIALARTPFTVRSPRSGPRCYLEGETLPWSVIDP